MDKILEIIQAVYNSNSPERDTVFDIHQIHGYYCYNFNSLSLQVNTDAEEIQKLANGVIPTGEPNLDHILNEYGFDSVSTSFGYPEFPLLTVYSKNEFNIIPIGKEFTQLDAVQFDEHR
ncbi:hypothetical protein [Flammeovirga aprica]|uniref:Uncharacterized protein n=1 Tax=Flammeovirga aprica JL-4 TaxID=694437 RepID=A0A7X9S260_9BACT|nr:hypothetical protein [Flammeovirga aprica]NME72983.1 hypothetical protein [Flammeovirga aprica JL-4]